MKQGNSSARVDRGWSKMRPILDSELPQKKRRKGILWLWLFPLALGIALVTYTILRTNSSQQIVSTESKTHSTTEPSKQDNLATPEEPEIKSITTNKLDTENLQTETIKKVLPYTTQKQSTTTTNFRNRNTTTKTTSTTSQSKATINNKSIKKATPSIDYASQSTVKKVLPTKDSTKKHEKAPKQIQPKLASFLPLIENKSSLRTLEYDKKIPDLRLAPDYTNTPIIVLDKKHNWNVGITGNGFYATKLQSYGIEVNLGLCRSMGKFNLGAQVGAGYYFDKVNLETEFTGPAVQPEGVFQPTATIDIDDMNFDALTRIHYSKKEHKPYLHTGIFASYNILTNMQIKYQVGIEKYFQKSLSRDGERTANNAAETSLADNTVITSLLDNNNLIIYNQLELDWRISNKFQAGIAYRQGLSELFSSQEMDFHPNKFYLSLGYNF